jgi:S-formylglutathione hydrolase FrmB
VLRAGLGGLAVIAAGGAAGVELVAHGVLPGKQLLDQIDGACSIDPPPLRFSEVGPTTSGRFFSQARDRTVSYTIAYPPRHRPGTELPLIVLLHAFGGSYARPLAGMSAAQALALQIDGRPLRPMAIATADGGNGYWHPRRGDNPMAMITNELIPMCQRLGLGRAPQRIGTLGISMGGYGALLIAEKHPDVISAVAAISPAIWTSYAQAHGADAGAYTSAANFAANDAVTHASALRGTPVRVASGADDPFYPGVQTLARALPADAVVDLTNGCHTSPFFLEQEPPSLAFLARHLTGHHLAT